LFFPGKSFHSLDAPQVNAIEHHRQLAGPQLDALGITFDSRHFEDAFLQTLVPQGISIPIPVKKFQSVSIPAAEQE
jgi:hypothetical protein